jgi:dihydroorotate dehydrogenase subfamily 1
MKFLGKEISGRFTIPSGIVGTEVSTLKRLAKIKEIGVLTTKSISLERREGNREPIVAQLEPGTFINAVGLANPGAEEFRNRLEGWQVPEDKFLLISIVGKDDDEFVKVAEILKDKADGFEINVSCPHGVNMGQIIGSDFEMVEKIVKRITAFGKPVVVKISPNLEVDKSVAAAVNGGAMGIAAINTVGPFESNILSFGRGGMSGKKVLEKGVEVISEIKKVAKDKLTIIASGGISVGADAKRYLEAGADILSVGSVLTGMSTDEIEQYFGRLEKDINEGTNTAEELIKKDLKMKYQEMEVEENIKFTEDLCWLKFNKPFTAEPGQFVMFFMPGSGEKPFSFYNKSGENLEILCSKRGCLTEKMFELKPGDKVKVRGPYGVPLNIAKDKKILFVAGGTGIAASKAFFETYENMILMVGARSGSRLSGVNNWQGKGKVMCYTDDGTFGTKGLATNDVKKVVDEFKPDYILACGPEVMNKSLVAVLSEDDLKKTYLMRENETKCGVGICGRCADKDGNRYCVDGYRAEK